MSPVIEAVTLTKHFRDVPALDAVTLSLEPGHIFGLLGRNGSGKTTLLQLAVGLLLPTAGKCRTLGTLTPRLGGDELEYLGYVPQSPRFFTT